MTKHSKGYLQAIQALDGDQAYSPEEAVRLVKGMARAKFDETVDVHLRTGADPRHAEQQVRGVVLLPHGRGKKIRVLVFATGEGAMAARDAGADYVGDDDLVQQIDSGWMDFDVAIATPETMGRIGKLGKSLGRRGLMPNPKTGTVVQPNDLPRAIDEAHKGRVEYRMDRTGNIHVVVGKTGFSEQHLLENLAVVTGSINRARPSGIKGEFIRSAYLVSTMGPGVRLDLAAMLALKGE